MVKTNKQPNETGFYLNVDISVPSSNAGLVYIAFQKEFLGSFLLTGIWYLHRLVLKLMHYSSDQCSKKLQSSGLHVASNLEIV